MTGLQRKSLASFSIVVCLLVFMTMGTTAARDEDLEIKELKYEITGQDAGSVSLALIIIVCNNSEIDYQCDLWIDMFNSKGVKIDQVSIEGIDGEANSEKKLTENVKVPRKDFSPPLKLNGVFKNVKQKR